MRTPGRVLVAVTLLVAACGGDHTSRTVLSPSADATARAAAIAIVSGNGQHGNAGERLAQPLVVRVTDAAGSGVSDVGVSFDVSGVGGLNGKDAPGPSHVDSQTDSTGGAQVTLEPYEVGRLSVTARVEGTQLPPVTFTADATEMTVEFRSLQAYPYSIDRMLLRTDATYESS